jgi:hypothetical protein
LALASDQLKMRRSETLLACQRERERRRRVDVLRANQACASAAVAEASAIEQRDTHVALCALRLADAHQAVRGRVIDLRELKRLTAVEQNLQRETVAVESALSEAEENLRKAESVLADAMLLLGSEVKLTRRWERLAGNMLAKLRRATEMAAELEGEDQVADSWSVA